MDPSGKPLPTPRERHLITQPVPRAQTRSPANTTPVVEQKRRNGGAAAPTGSTETVTVPPHTQSPPPPPPPATPPMQQASRAQPDQRRQSRRLRGEKLTYSKVIAAAPLETETIHSSFLSTIITQPAKTAFADEKWRTAMQKHGAAALPFRLFCSTTGVVFAGERV